MKEGLKLKEKDKEIKCPHCQIKQVPILIRVLPSTELLYMCTMCGKNFKKDYNITEDGDLLDD